MTTKQSLTEIARLIDAAEQEPITILDVMALINRRFTRAGKNFSGAQNKSYIEQSQDWPEPEVEKSQLPAEATGEPPSLSTESLLRAARNGLETQVPDYTEE